MQQGTVLYLTNAERLTTENEVAEIISRVGMDPAWAEMAASRSGYYSVQEALLRLAERGAHRVDAARCSVDETGVLQVSAERYRLWG